KTQCQCFGRWSSPVFPFLPRCRRCCGRSDGENFMVAFNVPEPVRIEIDKGIHSLEFVARRLGRQLFSSEQHRQNVIHDLEVCHTLNCLKTITVEYVGADGSVVFAQTIELKSNSN